MNIKALYRVSETVQWLYLHIVNPTNHDACVICRPLMQLHHVWTRCLLEVSECAWTMHVVEVVDRMSEHGRCTVGPIRIFTLTIKMTSLGRAQIGELDGDGSFLNSSGTT